jgi:hypothetical protein
MLPGSLLRLFSIPPLLLDQLYTRLLKTGTELINDLLDLGINAVEE